LRRQAEARERITQAAVLVSQERFEAADKLINQMSATEPSVDCAAVLRALSEWHALQGRWTNAADRFSLLLQVNQLDGKDQSTLDFLGCGVCLKQRGQADDYDQFCQMAISRFADTTNGVAAERIVKICLLKAPTLNLMKSLAPLARVAEDANAIPGNHDKEAAFRAAWEALSLSLWEYRQGHYARSADWARHCLDCPEPNAPRTATAHVELALALWQSGQKDESLRELSLGRQSIEGKFKGDLEQGSAEQGFWFDWVFARILLREAPN
jgi:hypothetical protein